MRTTPLIGQKLWFAPRRFGWGLDPVSPEGWALTAVMIGAGVARRRLHGAARRAMWAVLFACLVLTALKGTSPGGPRARAQFRAARPS